MLLNNWLTRWAVVASSVAQQMDNNEHRWWSSNVPQPWKKNYRISWASRIYCNNVTIKVRHATMHINTIIYSQYINIVRSMTWWHQCFLLFQQVGTSVVASPILNMVQDWSIKIFSPVRPIYIVIATFVLRTFFINIDTACIVFHTFE